MFTSPTPLVLIIALPAPQHPLREPGAKKISHKVSKFDKKVLSLQMQRQSPRDTEAHILIMSVKPSAICN